MEKSTQKNGLINLLALVGAGIAALVLAREVHSLAAYISAIFLGLGAFVAAVSWFQMRLEDREELERLEMVELARSRGSATMFEGKEETFPAQQSRLQFEKYFVPAFTIVLLLVEALVAWVMWRWLGGLTVLPLGNTLVGMAAFAAMFLVLFMLGKYGAGIARMDSRRLLRPGAGWLLLGSYVALLVTAGLATEEAGVKLVDFYLARGLTVLLALIAVETLLNLLLEIYRPRVKGKVVRPIYESRVVGFLSHPEGLFTTAAHTLDYQFGFKVSETWMYRVLIEKLPVFILGLGFAAIVSSCFVFLEPGEQALLERMGQPVDGGKVLGPGAHVKLPWPIDSVYRYRTGEVQSFSVGAVIDPKMAEQRTILWSVAHYKEELPFLVASRDETLGETNESASTAVPVNLLDAAIPIQFRIKDVREWAYGHAAPQQLLEQAANREVVRYFASVDLLEIMSQGREKAATDLRKNIQARADELKLGAEVLFVGLQDIHPPTSVAPSFEAVNGAAQEVQAKVFKAEGEATRTTTLAQAMAMERVRAAGGEALNRTTSATARGARYAHQLAAYQAAPDYYADRLYLESFARASKGTRKYIVASTNTHQVYQIDLEDKVRPDLGDINMTPQNP